MMARRSLLRLVTVFAAVVLSLLSRPAHAQTAKSFQLTSLKVEATVLADGSMQVEENVTYIHPHLSGCWCRQCRQ